MDLNAAEATDTLNREGNREGNATSSPAAPDPDSAAKLEALRQQFQSTFTQVVLAMSGMPRYRHQTLADLSHLVLQPLLQDRIAIATSRSDQSQEAPAGIAIWASISDDVHAKISEQIEAGVFPVRLAPGDWKSGERIWLFDIIAPNRQLAGAVLATFGQIAKGRQVHIHPLIRHLVAPELLERLRATDPQPSGQAGN